MRSAEQGLRVMLAGAALALLAACDSVPLGGPAPQQASASSKATSTPQPQSAPQSSSTAQLSDDARRRYDEAARALRAGRLDEAREGFQAVLRADPDLAGAHANLGIVERQAGHADKAVPELERAAKLSPRNSAYLNELGIACRQAGRFEDARKAYEAAIAADPAFLRAYLNLGILLDLYLQDSARALELYERYLALAPEGDPVVAKWVADLKNRQRKPAVAAKGERS